MNEEVFEEWEPDFLEELIQAEEQHVLSRATQNLKPNSSLLPSRQPPPPPLRSEAVSYSRPRQLSQRPVDLFDRFSNALAPPPVPVVQDDAKDQEIVRLKRELGRVSRQLTDLEHECSELRKERTKKEKQIESIYSNNDQIDVAVRGLKRANLEYGLPGMHTHVSSSNAKNTELLEEKTVHGIDAGVQTDNDGDCVKIDLEGDLSSRLVLQKKLLGIWSSTSDQNIGRDIISKVFMSCQRDFHRLFGCMSVKLSSKVPAASVACGCSSDVTSLGNLHSFPSSEAAKVSHLFSVLAKFSFYTACTFEASIEFGKEFGRKCTLLRDNVKVEGLFTGNNNEDMSHFVVSRGEASHMGGTPFGLRSSDSGSLCKSRYWNVDMALSCVNWISVFDLMRRIAISNRDERVRLEALSIMNLIMIKSNAYTERERFGRRVVFESVAEFLKNEAGSHVQKEALYLLYLLLNCPKLLSIFCSSFEEWSDDVVNEKKNASNIMEFSVILEGLADCVACNGNAVKDIAVRKRATILLAFLASSGKLGFQILVNHKLRGEATFLVLILQALMSEIDMEVSASVEPSENIKARISFIREALILLNRLVSNPDYSAVVLRALVANRDLASMTCDIASRLSRKDHNLRLPDSISQQIRDTEIVDLARGFRKRIFAYLGDNAS